MKKICPRCGKEFECIHSKDCWCITVHLSDRAKANLSKNYSDCLCKDCLEELNDRASD